MKATCIRREQCALVFDDLTKPWHSGGIVFTFAESAYSPTKKKSIYASRDVLKMWSPVFQDMLNSSDYNDCASVTIEIEKWRYGDFLLLMQIIHNAKNLSDMLSTVDTAIKVCPIAHHFEMIDVITQCEKVLVAVPTTWSMLRLANECTRLKGLRERCISWLARMSLRELESNVEFKGLSRDFQSDIIRRRVVYLENELPTLRVPRF